MISTRICFRREGPNRGFRLKEKTLQRAQAPRFDLGQRINPPEKQRNSAGGSDDNYRRNEDLRRQSLVFDSTLHRFLYYICRVIPDTAGFGISRRQSISATFLVVCH